MEAAVVDIYHAEIVLVNGGPDLSQAITGDAGIVYEWLLEMAELIKPEGRNEFEPEPGAGGVESGHRE